MTVLEHNPAHLFSVQYCWLETNDHIASTFYFVMLDSFRYIARLSLNKFVYDFNSV